MRFQRFHGFMRLVLLTRHPLSACTRLTGLDGKARRERIERGVGLDLSGVEVEFFAPDEPSPLALLDTRFEELAEDGKAIAGTDAGQARMIRQRLVQVIPEKPSDTESV